MLKEILGDFRQEWEWLRAADKEAWACCGMAVPVILICWGVLWLAA